jgi:hypothetical protein
VKIVSDPDGGSENAGTIASLEQPLVARARDLATVAHESQLRKASGIPYVVHLTSVAGILAEHGYDDDVTLAAAYLHDLLEDQLEHAPRFRREMPVAVVETVEAVTEQKRDEHGRAIDKRERFARYVAGLERESEATRRAIPVSCADKIDNLRSLVGGGPEGRWLLWRMNTRPGDQEPQLRRLRKIYAPVVTSTLLRAFDEAAEALLELIEKNLLNRAVALAAEAHQDRVDKAGAPYLLHPLRSMLRAATPDERLVAVLRDVLEDSSPSGDFAASPWTAEGLRREGFPRHIVRAVERLTRREGESYDAFIERVAGDGLATQVKLLDLEDNADPRRIAKPGAEDEARVLKYRRAMEQLRPAAMFRSLRIELDRASRMVVRRFARHPELHGDHVTLAFHVDPAKLSPTWLVGGARVGDHVDASVAGQVLNERVQALLVEIGGVSRRPFDGGPLHVTLSTTQSARAVESNALIESGAPVEPLALSLSGHIAWAPSP